MTPEQQTAWDRRFWRAADELAAGPAAGLDVGDSPPLDRGQTAQMSVERLWRFSISPQLAIFAEILSPTSASQRVVEFDRKW